MRYIILFVFYFFTFSCNTFFQTQKVQYQSVKVQKSTVKDSTLYYMLKPYSDSISGKMNVVIATVKNNLVKEQPNGSLGLVFVDAMRTAAERKFNTKVDGALINNGGLRIPSIQAGPLTVGKVYEVMPFDNLLVIQKVKGDVLRKFLELTIAKGGWPMSGISISIENTNTRIFIGTEELNDSNTYTIANSDYIANGGDDAVMLKSIPQINKGILLRDAFIEEFKAQKLIDAKKEQRFMKVKVE